MTSSKRWSLKIALFSVAMVFFMAGGNVFAQLVGGTTYPVNGTSNPPTSFENLREAAAYLTANGVTGTGEVILELQPGYTGINDSVTFRNIAGLGPTLGLTIRPAAGFNAVTSVTPVSGQPFWAIRLSGVSYVTLDGRQGGVGTTPSWTIQALGANGQQAVRLDHQLGSMTNNTVKYCILEGEAANNTAAILAITTATNIPANTFTNHEIAYNIIRSGATLRGYGITVAQMSNTGNTGNKIHHNEIYDFYQYGINITGGYPGLEVYDNLIYHSKNITQPTVSQFAGIYYSTSASPGTKIYNNKIYDIRLTNGSSAIHGIYLFNGNNAGAPNLIYNNFISIGDGLSGTAEPLPVWGIRDNSLTGSLFNIYHNSVYVGGTLPSGANNSAAYRREVNSAVNLRNNIFFNGRSNAGGTGTHWAISTNNVPGYLSINNNLYFANGTGGVLGTTDNTTTGNKTTLAAWKAAVSADNASVTGNPQFISTTNLHINTTQPTPVEANGSSGTGVTTDIDGDVRNVTTPDIGADEGDFILLDETGPTISYTALTNTHLLTNRTLSNVTITDVSGVAGDPNRPRMYFKKTTDVTWVSVPANETTSPYSFTTDYSLIGGVAVGDTIQYFVIAQDASSNNNVSALPGAGLVATSVNSISTYPTNPYIYRILPSISGTFNVGTGGDYPTLTAAVNDLNNKILTGPVTFLLTDPSYTTGETYPIVINYNAGSSSDNVVTIKPAPGVTTTITGNTASGVIALNGSDWIVIDGSNTPGGTTRDLSINNTYTGGTSNFVVGLFHDGSRGASNSAIKNCVLAGTPTVTTSIGIVLNATGGDYDNTVISNNVIKNAKIGIQFAGVASGIVNNGKILGNIIGDETEPIKQGGILVSNADNTLISGNHIFGEIAGNTNTSQYGVFLTTGTTNTRIQKNIIHDFYYTGTSGYGCYGIRYGSDASTVTEISNNFIYAIKADGDSTSVSFTPAGIYVASGGNIKLYYNSVNMTGNALGAGAIYHGRSAALLVASGVTQLDVRNNIFKNSQGSFPGSTRTNVTYAIYSASGASAFTNINHNDYFVNGVNPRLGFLNGVYAMDLAQWQAASGQDLQSISVNPDFVSDTDLHIDVTSPGVSNKGTPVAVLDDIDGDMRSVTTPDIGADEYVGVSPTAFNLLYPANGATLIPINGMLLWEKSQYANQYKVYLDVVNPPVTLHATVTDTTVAYSVSPTTTYYWKVIAENGNGTYETAVFSFTSAANPPAAPGNLTFTKITADSVYMSWTDNATDETGFRVYRSTDLNGVFTNVSGDLDSLVGTGLVGSYADHSLLPSVKYYYKVVAFSTTQGESFPALDSAVTYPVIPDPPTFANISYTSVNVIINENGNSAVTEYAIYCVGQGWVQTDGTFGATEAWQTYTQWGGAAGKKVTGLSVNTLYTFQVKARNLDGVETGLSLGADVTTLAPLALPFVEDFTSTTYPPTGWSRKGTVIGSRQVAVQPNGTSGGALRFNFYSVSSGSDTLITPLIGMTGSGIIVFRFSHAYRQYTTENDRFRVLLSTDDGATWDTTLFDQQGAALATLPPSTSAFTPSAASDWRNNLIIIPFSRYSNTSRLMLIATSAWGNNLWIDDIKVEMLKNVDYALTGISMVDGIPTPFILRTEEPGERYAETEMLTEKAGVPRSDVNNSSMITYAKPYEGKVKAYANDKNLTMISGLEATRDITMRFTVSNLGIDTTPLFDLAWDVDGVNQTGYSSTTGISFNSSVNVDLTTNFAQPGTYTTNGLITLPGDEDLTNNALAFHRTLVYPEPMVRIRYDNGTHTPNTFIGANGPAFLSGVRFTATSDMKLTNVDAYFRNEASVQPIEVRVYAAGTTTNAPGALLYTQSFSGVNYSSVSGDYFTLPLGPTAPSFAAGTDFWIAIRFADVPYPMGAHNTGFTAGRSFYSLDEGANWTALIISGTERAWLLRAVGTPVNPPTAVTLLEPADGSLITVDQSFTDNITFRWTASTDPDGDPVGYIFLASLYPDFSVQDTGYIGPDTLFQVGKNFIDSWLANNGIAEGDTATAYWKVIATDGIFSTSSSVFSVDFYRWKFTPTTGWVSQTSGTIEDLYSVKAVSQTVAWAVGAGGTVLATLNGGTTWVDRSGNAPWGTEDLYHVFAIDEHTAWVIADPADGAYIYRTTDGGTSWYQVYYLAGGFLNALYINGMNGYGVGDPVGGTWTVIQTTDGGDTWFRMATEPTAASASHFGYNNSFSVVGNNMWFGTNASRVYYSTDLGLTWNYATTTFTSTYDIQFNTLTNGIVAGNGIARTLNGGTSYTNITTVPGSGNFGAMGGAGDVDFWASRVTVINRTKNTGDTWAIEFTMPNPVLGMDFVTYVDGSTTYTSGWAVTQSGSIAAFFDTTTTVGVPDPTDVVPTAFALYQNYPNPFNPTTAIRYDLKENAKVTLKIYNALGQEVRTLVNTTQNAGSYTIHWDGKNDAGVQVASGVYIYRIQAGNFVKSHKMMLLK